MDSVDVAIIGAGPCGIGAAWTLSREFPERSFRLIDASEAGGGHAASLVTAEGFTFDYGGHVLFPHKKYVEFADFLQVLGLSWHTSRPIRGVYMHGRLIAAPIQRNVHALPMSVTTPIVLDLIRNRLSRKSTSRAVALNSREQTLAEFLHETFGDQLAERVMKPLNRKMWTLDPTELNSVWVHKRSGSSISNVPGVMLRRLLFHALLGKADSSWTVDSQVSYPASGGNGSIWIEALKRIPQERVSLGKRVAAIDLDSKQLMFEDETILQYRSLISTMPLAELLKLCLDRPDLATLAAGLRWSSAILLGFGIRGSVPRKYVGVHSFLCPEASFPFWRVTLPSNLSPDNVKNADNTFSVLCETSCSPGQELAITDQLRASTSVALRKIGLLNDKTNVVSIFEKLLPYGYPVPFLGRDKILTAIHRHLEPADVLSRGRFGGWRYEVSNQDYAFVQGAEAVRRSMTGEREITYG